eukprot:m.98993 g.98993  ORF g.98993 m.98993 type:complete len:119 (+) comp13657_c0_seq2:2075-2431(+)
MPSEEPGDPANDYDSIGVVEPVVLPEDQDKVEDPTDSYEFMEAPSKANKVEEGSPNNQDASETTDEVELNPANAPKVREMRNEDRITLMFMVGCFGNLYLLTLLSLSSKIRRLQKRSC